MPDFKTYFKTKFVSPLLGFLKQGVTPRKLSLCIALGFICGIFPVLGSTTLLCGITAYVLKLNQPAIQLINYFVYPLQLILFIPFFKLGGLLFSEPFSYSLPDLYQMLQNDWLETIRLLWVANLRAIMIWLTVSPIIGVIIYYPVFAVLSKLDRKSSTEMP